MGNVLVVVEQLNGKTGEITFEMLGKGRELASALGGELHALVIGGQADELGIADKVWVMGDGALAHYTSANHKAALVAAISAISPRVTLIGNTSIGMDLAAGASAATGIPLIAYCNALRVEGGQVVGTSQIYGGKVLAEVAPEDGACIVSVLAGAFPASAGRSDKTPVLETLAPPALDNRVRFVRLIEPEAADVDITKAAVVVSVGRGIQSADNIELADGLADALGGVVGASRPVTDAGWLPKSRQVGKSGLRVKPKLYLALGISGAPEHLEGMKDSGLIIAINQDASAPIFDVAHYGVVGDLFEIVPALTEKIKG
ncbi:MAG: electron transfer flavoprotein subunit alpha/FixB family protein [Chloroflexi bacterium]|nr:electron transfer flavoprotein subunit alpha/FixB family protein [Chloroflexota bacterium]